MQEVIAAITTAPCSSAKSLAASDTARCFCAAARPRPAPASGRARRRPAPAGGRVARGERLGERCRSSSYDAEGVERLDGTPPSPARAARGPAAGAGRRATARRRRGRARRPASRSGGRPASCQSMFSLQYASTSATRSGGPAGQAQVRRASARRPGRSRRSRRTRATCSRASRGRRATGAASPWPKYSTNLPTTPVARRISVTVRTRSVAVAPSRQRARQPEADDLRHEHRERLAEHRRLGLDPADAPAEHAEPVDHRRVRVGADERVREGDAVAVLDDAREVLEVHLVADAGARAGRP